MLLGDQAARQFTAYLTGILAIGFTVATAMATPRLLPVAAVLLAGAAGLAPCALTWLGRGNPTRNRRPYRVFMATQYLAHLTLLCMVLGGSQLVMDAGPHAAQTIELRPSPRRGNVVAVADWCPTEGQTQRGSRCPPPAPPSP